MFVVVGTIWIFICLKELSSYIWYLLSRMYTVRNISKYQVMTGNSSVRYLLKCSFDISKPSFPPSWDYCPPLHSNYYRGNVCSSRVFTQHWAKRLNLNMNNRFNILTNFHDLNMVIMLLKTLLPFCRIISKLCTIHVKEGKMLLILNIETFKVWHILRSGSCPVQAVLCIIYDQFL